MTQNTTQKGNAVIRKRGETTKRLIPRNDEQAKNLTLARKVNPFRERGPLKKGETLDTERIIDEQIKKGLKCSVLFDSVEVLIPLQTQGKKLENILSVMYPYLEQTRSFSSRFVSHFKTGDTTQRAMRRKIVDLSDYIIQE